MQQKVPIAQYSHISTSGFERQSTNLRRLFDRIDSSRSSRSIFSGLSSGAGLLVGDATRRGAVTRTNGSALVDQGGHGGIHPLGSTINNLVDIIADGALVLPRSVMIYVRGFRVNVRLAHHHLTFQVALRRPRICHLVSSVHLPIF